jgi:hypothetical protein
MILVSHFQCCYSHVLPHFNEYQQAISYVHTHSNVCFLFCIFLVIQNTVNKITRKPFTVINSKQIYLQIHNFCTALWKADSRGGSVFSVSFYRLILFLHFLFNDPKAVLWCLTFHLYDAIFMYSVSHGSNCLFLFSIHSGTWEICKDDVKINQVWWTHALL